MSRQCSVTGMELVEDAITVYRVSVNRVGRGPLNPLARTDDPAASRETWNRFDAPGLTIYGADQRVTAFVEALAYAAPSANEYAALHEEAHFHGISFEEYLTELRMAGFPVGLDSDWRLDRAMYLLEFPAGGWVDLTHPHTVAAIRRSGISDAESLGISELTGDDRDTTTRIAQWVRAQELDTGNRPAGIRYKSKLGFQEENDSCYAVFLNAANTGCTDSQMRSFAANDPDLLEAVRCTGVHVP